MSVKIGLVFAGQGVQTPNMGLDFYEQYPYVQKLYQKASEILGYRLQEICFSDDGLMNQTLYTQPAIVTTSLAIYQVFQQEFQLPIAYCAGFSLGEYSALHACGVYDFETTLKLIKKRAEFLDEDTKIQHGAMAAVIGLETKEVERLVSEYDGVYVANYNSPTQVVVSGLYDRVLALKEEIVKLNKRCIMLNVSGAFHTILMENASNKMYEEVLKYSYSQPRFPLICNENASPLIIENIASNLKKQIQSPVRFMESIQKMIDEGVNLFVEIGPGNVLAGFIRKINPLVKVISLDKVSDLEKVRGYLHEPHQ